MSLGNYTTAFLMGVLEDLRPPTPQFLLDFFFRKEIRSDSETIYFDKVSRNRKLAPFVLPTSQAMIVNPRGYTQDSFKPAYVKPMIPMDFQRPMTRLAGEPLNGTMSAQARRDVLVMQDLDDLIDMINARMEWMAASVLNAGAITIVGDLYPSKTVDFARDAALTVTLTLGDRWSQSGSTPLLDLDEWRLLVLTKGKVAAQNVLMDPTAWTIFSNHIDVKEHMSLVRQVDAPLSLDLNKQYENGAVLMGTIRGYNIWVYSGDYEADNGTTTPLLAANTVLMVGDIEGVRCFGAIKDIESLVPVPYFPKMWTEPNPGMHYVMVQSAPLLVPLRVNASLKATIA